MEPSDQGVSDWAELQRQGDGAQGSAVAERPIVERRPVAPPGLARAGLQGFGLLAAAAALLGAWRGSVVLLAAGLLALTAARTLYGDVTLPVALAGVALVIGAVAVGATRWGTTLLTDVRGAQAVLGPAVLVAPRAAAAGAWTAAAAGVVGLGVWLSRPARPASLPRPAGVLEAAAGVAAIVSVAWGPTISEPADVLHWVGAAAVVAAASWGMSKAIVPPVTGRHLLALAPVAVALAAAAGLISVS